MLGSVDANNPGLRHQAEPAGSLFRLQVVIMLRHQDRQRLAGLRPFLEVHIRGPMQRRGQQDRAFDPACHRLHRSIHQRQFRPERPPHQPAVRQAALDGETHSRLDVVPLTYAFFELSLTCPARR
ncbi:hypothetical protein PJL18_00437 [Paenarthrobacter nicotinovorans]|nr:hypothetical protein [Paenarthrobacter nicotinovorans]